MAKKHLYFDEAERLYCIEQNTLDEISSRMPVAESTLRLWKAEGDWGRKRKQYLESRQAFHEELYEFSRSLMRTIKDDMDSGQKVDPGRMYSFTRLIPMITKVKDYEEISKKAEQEKPSGITPDLVEIIEREVLGIRK